MVHLQGTGRRGIAALVVNLDSLFLIPKVCFFADCPCRNPGDVASALEWGTMYLLHSACDLFLLFFRCAVLPKPPSCNTFFVFISTSNFSFNSLSSRCAALRALQRSRQNRGRFHGNSAGEVRIMQGKGTPTV